MRMRPVSILFFTNTRDRGGAEEHMLTLLRGLDRTYFRMYLVCPSELAEKLQSDLPSDVELIPLSLRKPFQIRAALRLGMILRKKRVDVLHSHLFCSSLFASPVGFLSRVPVILETPHLSERWRHGWFKSRFAVDRFVGCFVDRYIAVSDANAHYLAEEKCLPRDKIVVIRNGCDLARFDPDHLPPAGLKEALGFHEEDPILVISARLEPQKGHRILLQAMQSVRRAFPLVRLVCLGEGCLRNELESQVHDLGLEGSVRFLGYQSNVMDWLALACLTVLPSLWEGLPLSAIESLAAGCPMVATAVDGTPEVVINGKTGLTVPPGDPESLASAICSLIRQPELRRIMGAAGRKWVMEHFSEHKQIRQTQELYLNAVETWRTASRSISRMRKTGTSKPISVPTVGHNQ